MDYLGILAGLLAVVLFVWLEFLVRKKKLLLGDKELLLNGSTIPYNKISNISITQSSFQRIFGFGDVKLNDIMLKDFQWPFRLERLVSKRRVK
ncbi:MAG TPA: PH domain-containing protein [Candidatus Nanoarchaeia archaeon]|nr:PH domain-containing protein [Candidatus Nanoarchaeia archaeon]